MLKQLEQQRNAKITGEGITEYGQTNYYQNGYTPSGSGGGSKNRPEVFDSIDRGNSVDVPGYGIITYDDALNLINEGYVDVIGRNPDGTAIFAQTTKKQTGPIRLTR